MDKPFQCVGSSSNAHVGREFEHIAYRFFLQQGLHLYPGHIVEVGVGSTKKAHAFDLGCSEQKVVVECKSHRWTAGHNVPSAKLTVWNEAMYYFHVSPPDYRKIMFVLKDLRRGGGESLASYYLRTYNHLVPVGIEFWEYDESIGGALRVGT
ncbi:hypothetical protein [Nitrosomonas ureae]|uniref:Uncharacterized protein n=1 Tax=Nitrosomonas ureae TaxID=44577 RepID=A0A1H5XJU3_9PROT|nr:hypothetical protein [Nitrosomonas ureae]SEG12009.1 hypothetical protein SAMN05216334_12837 [Nitrosomonas ureae]